MTSWQAAALTFAIMLAGGGAVQAQQAKLPPIFRTMLGAGSLVKGGDGEAAWAEDRSGLWYASDGHITLYAPDSAGVVATVPEAELRAALALRFGGSVKTARLPLSSFHLIGGKLQLRLQGVAVTYDLRTSSIEASAEPPLVPGRFERNLFMYPGFSAPEVASHDGARLATVVDGDIAVRDSRGVIKLTATATPSWGWDLESGRSDIGNLKATPTSPWSPDDRLLFAMRIDRRAMPQVADSFMLQDPPGKVVMRDVFRAGGPYYHFSAAIIDVGSQSTRPVTGVEFGDDHVLLLGWAEDGRTVYVGAIDHAMTQARVIAIEAATGAGRVIFTDSAEAALRPPHQIYYGGNFGFTLLPSGRGFLWQSERDGWNQLYLHDMTGRLVRKLTRAAYPVDDVKGIDLSAARVIFTARADPRRPYDVHLLSVSLDGGPVRRLTKEQGVHDVTLSPNRRYFVDHWSSPAQPPQVGIGDVADGAVRVFDHADITRLQAAGWRPPIEFVIKATDGVTDLYGVMYRPAGFDPSQKYPIIEDIYGGPTLINADHDFVASPLAAGGYHTPNLPLALAQLGYLVVKFDTPGTPGRSRMFQLEARDRWGPGLAADHAAVIRGLAQRFAYVDLARVGVFGHSWGGLNALFAIETQDDLFDAAVATGIGADREGWRDGFMEAYLGSPSAHPERWTRQDVFARIGQIRKPLLLGAGTQDYLLNVNTLRISQALIDRGILHEYVPAPGSAHAIYGPNGTYFVDKTAMFFLGNLPAGGRPQ